MTADEIIAWVAGLPGVHVLTAGPDNGAPEAAWGHSFFSLDDSHKSPFATIVTSDYEGFGP